MSGDHSVREKVAVATWDLFHNTTISIEQFLREIRNLFPEIALYSTLCDSTPDLVGNIPHPNETLVLAVFPEAEVREWSQDSSGRRKISEINKLLLRFLYLRSIIQGNRSLFTSLSSDRFTLLRELIIQSCSNQDQLLFLVLSILFDDLGRTYYVREIVLQAGLIQSNNSSDHDKIWRLFLQHFQAFVDLDRKYLFEKIVPSFHLLNDEEQKRYKNQVMTNSFNLGAFVQGESVPYSFYELICSSNGDYDHRIIVLIFAFISFRYNHEFEAIGFTNPMYDQFFTAALIILNARKRDNLTDIPTLQRLCLEVYNTYLATRAQMIGFPTDLNIKAEERFVLYRIIALSRSSTQVQWQKIWFIWNKLSSPVKQKLLHYMRVTGFEKEKAIYIYYAPALIANTIASAKKLEEFSLERDDEEEFDQDGWTIGLFHGLRKLAAIYELVAKTKIPKSKSGTIFIDSPHGSGAYIYNAADDAVEMTEFHRTLAEVLHADNVDAC